MKEQVKKILEVLGIKNPQMHVIKRNGKEVEFDYEKIVDAICKANDSVLEHQKMSPAAIADVVASVVEQANQATHALNIEDIQDIVQNEILKVARVVGINYATYRYKRDLVRKANTTDEKILSLLESENEEVKQENANKNPTVASVQRDYMAGEVSRDLADRLLLPREISEAHKNGLIHFHDTDYFAQHIHNCCLVDIEDMLNNGTVISDVGIDTPRSIDTAANIVCQIVALVASNQYGGQTWTLTDLVGGRHKESINFVDVSRQKIRKELFEDINSDCGCKLSEEELDLVTEKKLQRTIKSAMQTVQYQLITLQTTNGQAPFVSVFMYLNEVVDWENDPVQAQKRRDLAMLIQIMLEQRILGVKNEKGVYITPAFPKLLYVLEEDNVWEGSEYFYLTELAAKCTAKRMVPDYISEKVMKELKGGDVYPCMGCRSFLTPDSEGLGKNGEHKYYGRFNQGVLTINLPDIALSSGGDEEKFWEIFDERMEKLVHAGLRCRHERLLGTPSDIAPILWQHGALGRLEKGEPIDKLLFGNYSTISIGYAGLAETVRYMKDCSHTSEEGKEFGLKVMQFLNDKAAKWRAEENISYSVYGTPLESTTYKFAKALQKRFGVIPGVSDKNYITNSYHVHVTEKIDAFTKLTKEAEFQKLSPGGAISYVEVPNMQHNIPAVVAIIQHIYNTIMYAELNTKSDYCQCCGFDGEIQIVEDTNGKLVWECPNCGNRDEKKMNIARRTCGYIGTNGFNQGRTQEIKERFVHVSIGKQD